MAQTDLHMNPGGMQDAASRVGTRMGNIESSHLPLLLAEGKKQLANLEGGAGDPENQAVWREYERRVTELVRGGRAGQAGVQTAADHGQNGIHLMRRMLGQSQA